MTEPTASVGTKRILVALDTSARGQAALQAAVQLATSISAELQGLFVEDEDLVRLASLPFVREVDVTSALSRPLQVAEMERELRAVAEQTQQAFASALGQLNLAWTFRIVRGTLTHASLAAAGDADMLVIGQRGRSPKTMTKGNLFPRSGRENRMVAIFDGSPSAFRAIELGNTLAQLNDVPLTVLVLADDGDERARQCMAWLRQQGIRAEVDQSLSHTENRIIDYVSKYPPAMLLINRDSHSLNESKLCDIVNQFDGPLILC